ncbi:MAG: hypothetical protein AB9903_03220 [Vulcanimicrobiota bacterium]
MRKDLLSLSADDLTALTNRGTVMRAQKEVEKGEISCQWSEDSGGSLKFTWTDGPCCEIPGGKTLEAGLCTCPSAQLCRHLIRSVLFYQHEAERSASSAPEAPECWNPGDITDEVLEKEAGRALLSKAKSLFDRGLLVELTGSTRPMARFLSMPFTVKFPVPHDIRYSYCDCAGASPCIHALIAVLAFRALPEGLSSGLVSSAEGELPPAEPHLHHLETLLSELFELGLEGLPAPWRGSLAMRESLMRKEGLLWPGDVVMEFLSQHDRYRAGDALFSPEMLTGSMGELMIRMNAITGNTGALPQRYLRGVAAGEAGEGGAGRYISLGCSASVHRKGASFLIYLQENDTGTVTALEKSFPDPPPDRKEKPGEFHRLARTILAKGASLYSIASGQLIVKGSKKMSDNRMILNRAKVMVHPQSYQWEHLKPPVLAEDFGEIRARIAGLPPLSLRPRIVGESLHAVKVKGVKEFFFDEASQKAVAVLLDAADNQAVLIHRYVHRAREGFSRLLSALSGDDPPLRYVAGLVRLDSEGLVITPTALVFEENGVRTPLFPWLDSRDEKDPGDIDSMRSSDRAVTEFPVELSYALGDLVMLGVRRVDDRVVERWKSLTQSGVSGGYLRISALLEKLTEQMTLKLNSMSWDPKPAAQILMELSLLSRLGADLL